MAERRMVMRQLTVNITEEEYLRLLDKAKASGRTLEEAVSKWLSDFIGGASDDPLLQMSGVFSCDVSDISTCHDDYIGAGIQKGS
ncbi:MAG: hypothetical protein IT210_24865 [Armatimonadetes bacterium]|nr:hypothetical protein [Armatimonadota bacterium]